MFRLRDVLVVSPARRPVRAVSAGSGRGGRPGGIAGRPRRGAGRRGGPAADARAEPQREGRTLMLVLQRYVNEEIVIGDDVVVTVVAIFGNKVRLGIPAPV